MYASKSIFGGVLFLSLTFAAGLPVVFEPTTKPAEFLARIGASAVIVTSQGVRFDNEVELKMNGARFAQGKLEGPLKGTSSYFHGTDRAQWRPAVPHFERVRFHSVYAGIDVVYYGRGGNLEYDFLAAPHADLTQIELSFTTQPTLTPAGDLRVVTTKGELLHRHPRVFQHGHELNARYNNGHIEIDGVNPNLPLTIDPVIESSTYLGGGSYEAAKALKIDSQGNLYLAGQAPSPGVFSGPFPSTNNPGVDVALIKFNPQSNSIAYYVFLGGDQDDIANSLALDASGAAYITGTTRSSNFPVTNAFQPTPGGGGFSDAFVVKIAPDGKSIAYASYLGGAGSDEAYAIAVDGTGAAYIGGTTGSRNFPVQPGALQANFGGSILNQSATGFVAMVAPAGNKIVYATLLGGSRQDQVRALALDANNNVYAAGNTSSPDFPVRNAVQTSLPGLAAGFIAKLSPDLSQLAYSTYAGGRGTTAVNALTVDPQGSAIAAGYTSSTDLPIKNAPQITYGGGDRDGFIVRLTPQGGDYIFSTYLGGSGNDTINDLTLESNGLLTVVGSTASADFPQRNGLQSMQGKPPNQEAFVTKFLLPSSSLMFSTLIGGTGDDQAFGVQIDSTGATYIAGVTASPDFPIKGSAYQAQYGGGNGDMFLIKLSADPSLAGSSPSINVSPTVLNFVAAQGAGAPAAAAPVAVTSVSGSLSFTVDWSGGTWLSAGPPRADAPATVNVFTNQAGLAMGIYSGTVRIIPSNGTLPIVINVTLTVANPAPYVQAINPPRVPTGSPDTEFTLSGTGFTGSSTVQISLDDGSLSQALMPTTATDSTLRFIVSRSLLFRDTLLQLRVKDPASPAASNTVGIQVGDRFPTIASIASAASSGGDAIAPGEYITISGSTIGPTLPQRVLVGDGAIASSLLGGVRVLFDGVAAPLLIVVDRKVVAVTPWSLAAKQTTQVVIEYLGVRSNPVNMPVTPTSPALFTADGSGTGQGLIFNESGLSNAAFLPAPKGSTIVLYFTGGGVMSPGGVDGKIAGTLGSGPVQPVSVLMDGIACEVLQVGNALGEVTGMVQASVRVPPGVRNGSAVPVQVTVGGVTSQLGVVISIN